MAKNFKIENPEIYSKEHKKFMKKKLEFKKEMLLYEAAELMVKKGLLTQEEEKIYKRLLITDKKFSTQIHCLFEIFNSIELVEKNIDKVYYHVRSSLNGLIIK